MKKVTIQKKRTKESTDIDKEKELQSKRGKNSKRKGANFERTIAKKLSKRYGVELKRTPQSGGFAKKSEKADDYRGDITIVDTKNMLALHIECKNTKTWSLPAWLRQATEDCPEGRKPIVVFHNHNTSEDYVSLSLDDFLELVDKSKVIVKREFK